MLLFFFGGGEGDDGAKASGAVSVGRQCILEVISVTGAGDLRGDRRTPNVAALGGPVAGRLSERRVSLFFCVSCWGIVHKRNLCVHLRYAGLNVCSAVRTAA